MDGPGRIDDVFAYVVLEDDGTETIPVVPAIDEREPVPGLHMPMLAAGLPRIRAMRRHLFRLPFLRGKRVQLVKFTRQETLETITVREEEEPT
jgi:hypothetical protein